MLILDTDQYQVVLGTELRRLRVARGWSRRDVLSHLSMSISSQTLASWEHGSRAISMTRFTALCLTLGERPHVVLERIHRDVIGDPMNGGGDSSINVDLGNVASIEACELRPLRQWATTRLRAGDSTAVTLPPAAVDRMAQLCGVPPDRIRAVLAQPGGPDAHRDISQLAS